MRSVVQRVNKAGVQVSGKLIGEISMGILALIGIGLDDGPEDIRWMADKLVGLRIFEDQEGKMNLSLPEVDGEILLVSQFTLFGDCRKGKRPSFSHAAPPERAKELFEELAASLRYQGVRVETGEFQAHMEVSLVNDGPVTILLDSKRNF